MLNQLRPPRRVSHWDLFLSVEVTVPVFACMQKTVMTEHSDLIVCWHEMLHIASFARLAGVCTPSVIPKAVKALMRL